MRGLFVSFEGIEGCGKSTQAQYLYDYCMAKNIPALITREPGGTEMGLNIRQMILDSGDVSPRAELLLFLADRAQHVHETISPALEEGIVVICDRFHHSTLAYQSGGRGMERKLVEKMNLFACDGVLPDLSFLIDVPVGTGFDRKRAGHFGLDRIEREDEAFHTSIRNAYLQISEEDPKMVRVDGNRSRELVHHDVLALFEKLRGSEI